MGFFFFLLRSRFFENWKRSSPSLCQGCLFPWVTVLIVDAAHSGPAECPCAASGSWFQACRWHCWGAYVYFSWSAFRGWLNITFILKHIVTVGFMSRSWDASLTYWWVIGVTKPESFFKKISWLDIVHGMFPNIICHPFSFVPQFNLFFVLCSLFPVRHSYYQEYAIIYPGPIQIDPYYD